MLLLFVAFLIAWHYGDDIGRAIAGSLPWMGSVLLFLFPDVSGRGAPEYIVAAVMTFLVWLGLRLFLNVMGFALPQAVRFSSTKEYRRVQGVSAELLVVGIIAFPMVVLGVLGEGGKDKISERVADEMVPGLEAEIERNRAQAQTLAADMRAARTKLDEAAASYLRELRAVYTAIDPDDAYERDFFDRHVPESNSLTLNTPSSPEWLRLRATNRQIALEHEKRLEPLLAEYESRQGASDAAARNLAQLEAVRNDRAQLQARAWESIRYSPRRWLMTFRLAADGNIPFLAIGLALLFGWGVKERLAAIHGRILRILEAGRFGVGGSARFATLVEEWPLRWRRHDRILRWISERPRVALRFGWLLKRLRESQAKTVRANTLFLGRSLYNPLLHVGITDDRHMLTIAGSRTGKGSTAIVPNLLTWAGSCIVVDPKGTNALVTARRRKDFGDVFVVDPFHIVTERLGLSESHAFNPLDAIDLDSIMVREQIAVLADALVVPNQDSRQDHWDNGARTVIRGLLTHLRTEQKYQPASLPMIRDLLTTVGEEQIALWSAMLKNKAGGGAARDAASRIVNGIDTDEIRNILSNAHGHTEWLSSPAMMEVLSRSNFNFMQLRQRPTTVYLVLPLEALVEHRRFLRLFINLAINQMTRGGKSEIPVLMLLDEFLTLGHMKEVENAFVHMAGYNLIVWPFAQDYGQLFELYRHSVSSFVTNSRAIQVFGVSDPETTRFVSEKLGNRSFRNVLGISGARSEPFRTPGEVEKEIERDMGIQYILRSGKAPLLLERVPYFEDRDARERMLWMSLRSYPYPFTGLYDSDPDHAR